MTSKKYIEPLEAVQKVRLGSLLPENIAILKPAGFIKVENYSGHRPVEKGAAFLLMKIPIFAKESYNSRMEKTALDVQAASWISQVEIRHLCATDLPGLEWDGEYTHFRRLYQDAWQRMENGLAVHWVAELSGVGLIGQVFVQLICDRPELADGVRRAYLFSFRIRQAYRNRGLGSAMLLALEDDLRARQFHSVTLNVAKENIAAQRMYQRDGFMIVAHEPGIWSYPDAEGVWHKMVEPAWRMEKYL